MDMTTCIPSQSAWINLFQERPVAGTKPSYLIKHSKTATAKMDGRHQNFTTHV
jgi:hypothetical protein